MNYLQQELYNSIQTDQKIFDFIQATALDGMWYWDLENADEEWMNDSFWITLGYDPNKMPHKASAWQDLIHPDDLGPTYENFAKHCDDPNHPYDQIVRYKHKKGHTVWIRCKGVVIRDQKGKPIRMLGSHIDVTRQKELEKDLSDKVDRHRQIIEGSQIGTWEWNISTNYFECNDQWYQLYGEEQKQTEQWDSLQWSEKLHPEDYEPLKNALIQHLKGETEQYKTEGRIRHKDGMWKWLLISGQVMERDSSGKAMWLRGSIIDITERKENELLLSKYKNLLDKTNKVARIGTWEVNLERDSVTWSKVTSEIHEVPIDFVPELEAGINFFPEGVNRDSIITAFNNAIEKGQGYDLELQILTAKNNLVWVRAIGIPVIKNNKCTSVYGVFQDINQIKQKHQQLTHQERLLRLTFDNAPHGMALLNEKGNWTRANKKSLEIFDLYEEQLLNKNILSLIHPEDKNSFSLKSVDANTNYVKEVRILTESNAIKWLNVSISVIPDDNITEEHFICQFEDITEAKSVKTKVDRLLSKTKAQNHRLYGFANIVSHNLRSHSSNLKMLLDIILQEKENGLDDEIFEMLQAGVGGLEKTITNLNEVVKVDDINSEIVKGLRISDFVNEALTNLAIQIKTSEVEIINEVDSSHEIMGTPAYLDSILINLISNAIKYRSKERKPFIHLKTIKQNNCIVITVKDNGLGINADLVRDKMFGMYKTFHGNDDARGIGLFLTKSHVISMGGEISFESQVDVGSTFAVKLRVNEV